MRQVLFQVMLQVLQRGSKVKSWSSKVQARSARWRSQVRRRRTYLCVRKRGRRRRSRTIKACALRCTRELVELVGLLVLLAPTQRTPRTSNAQRLRPARAALKTRLERAPLPQRKRASLVTCNTCNPCNSNSNSTCCRTLVPLAH